jgi:dsDNA-specific endonuclease/ATPase MutS2
MAKLKLDLHPLYDQGERIEREMARVLDEACARRIPLVEIIPGKGSGQLKKRVLRFLHRPAVRQRYHRLDVDNKNFGRLFVHFRHGK